jgi:putative membrane protein
MHASDLPIVNASLNALSTVFLLAGYRFIKTERKQAHIVSMLCALGTSTAFLACYVTYHALKHGVVTRFTYPGWPRTVYFCILGSHVPLAFLTLPLVYLTILPAYQARYDRHRRLAKWTFPIWLYVSVTGVLVYLMLYVWYPPVILARPTPPDATSPRSIAPALPGPAHPPSLPPVPPPALSVR